MLSSNVIVLSLSLGLTLLVHGRSLHRCHDTEVYCICEGMPNKTLYVYGVKGELFEHLSSDCSRPALSKAVCLSHACLAGHSTKERMDVKEIAEGMYDGTPKKRSVDPVKFVISARDETGRSRGQTRIRRFPKTCSDSLTPLKNTVITCWAWPDFLTCEFSCTYGYALNEKGKSLQKTTRNCRENENYWQPEASFPVCKPYIPCRTYLNNPGDLTCKTEAMNPAYCDISCLPDGEHDEVPMKRYECLNEEYAKTLPHCASVNTTIVLVDKPTA